jgi:hypothetical protein
MKVARKTGSLGAELASNLGRMVRQTGLSTTKPVFACAPGGEGRACRRLAASCARRRPY